MKNDTGIDYTMSRVACFFLVFLFVWQNQCLFPWDFEGVGVHQAPKPEARTAPAVRNGELGEKGIRAHFLDFFGVLILIENGGNSETLPSTEFVKVAR